MLNKADLGLISKFTPSFLPPSRTPSTRSNGSAQPRTALKISKLARMVLETTDVAFINQSIDKIDKGQASTPLVNHVKYKAINPKACSLPTPALSSSPDSKLVLQPKLEAITVGALKSVGSRLTPNQKGAPMVVIPQLPPSVKKEEYVLIHDAVPNRPSREATKAHQGLLVRAVREEENGILQRSQHLMLEIFEAQDQIDSHGLGHAQEENMFFEYFNGDDQDFFWLRTKMHSKIQNSARKLLDSRRFNDLPVEDIKRLQKICEPALLAARTLNFGLSDHSDAACLDDWKEAILKAENGVTAACTMALTMLGCTNDKELCAEDVVEAFPAILSNIFENCLIPLVETRSNSSDGFFNAAVTARELLSRLLHQGKKLLDLFTRLSLEMGNQETATTAIEYLAVKLVFVENSRSDKDSLMGFQAYENMRRSAMECLAKIFAKYSDHRTSILTEILGSLEKLPVSMRNARQFKLNDGKNIQLLTALILYLVQMTAVEDIREKNSTQSRRKASLRPDASHEIDEGADIDTELASGVPQPYTSALQALSTSVKAAYLNAYKATNYIVNYFVGRAMKSTKSGDEPFRNLLDLFTQDLLLTLSLPEWPGSELVLRVLAKRMIAIARDDKAAATAKNMSLESLGWMGSEISNLRINIGELAGRTFNHASGISQQLAVLAKKLLQREGVAEEFLSSNGPYFLAINELGRSSSGDWQTDNATGFMLVQWAVQVVTMSESSTEEGMMDSAEETAEAISAQLKGLGISPRPIMNAYVGADAMQARLSFLLTVWASDFCGLLEPIVTILLISITSDQAKTRSRSLKSVIAMLEVDPTLLDTSPAIVETIFRCATDSSPMVRDSALSLIAKCMALRPAIQPDACQAILQCASDSTTGVRKRSLGLLKDIYLHETSLDLKATIAKRTLACCSDAEDVVANLARWNMIDIWLNPFITRNASSDGSTRTQVDLADQAIMIVRTVSIDAQLVLSDLETLLQWIFKEAIKDKKPYHQFLRSVVATLFDKVLGDDQSAQMALREYILPTLTAFARSDPSLFTADQLLTLQPYIKNLSTSDDLYFFRSVVIIFRCVLPQLSISNKPLLADIQTSLFQAISKLARPELNEVMSCLWTINNVLQNTDRLMKLLLSVVKGITASTLLIPGSMLDTAVANDTEVKKLKSYIRIAGSIGKYWDLEKYLSVFERAFPGRKFSTVHNLIADALGPFTFRNVPSSLRIMAVESLGLVAQSWPGLLRKDDIRAVFESVFTESNEELTMMALQTFDELFAIHESSIAAQDADAKVSSQEDLGRLAGSLQASEQDGAANMVAQHFLPILLRTSKAERGENSVRAVKVLTAINRQGLVHPKECISTLICLQTSPNGEISKLAIEAHQRLHQQHESMFEREYARAIDEAFNYQIDTLEDSNGATTRPYLAKLNKCFEIIQSSNSKYVRKFLNSLVSKMWSDASRKDDMHSRSRQLYLSKFIGHNIAFFDFIRVDELCHMILYLEATFGKASADLAQSIESMFHRIQGPEQDFISNISNEVAPAESMTSAATTAQCQIDKAVLEQLTIASMMLTIIWETRSHLRRQYGISMNMKAYIAKSKDAKELAKSPVKVHGITGDKFWDRISIVMDSLISEDSMVERCQEFAILANVDEDKVVGEDNDAEDPMTASLVRDGQVVNPPGRPKGAKRRISGSVGGTPKKNKGRPSLKGRRASSINSDEDDEAGWD